MFWVFRGFRPWVVFGQRFFKTKQTGIGKNSNKFHSASTNTSLFSMNDSPLEEIRSLIETSRTTSNEKQRLLSYLDSLVDDATSHLSKVKAIGVQRTPIEDALKEVSRTTGVAIELNDALLIIEQLLQDIGPTGGNGRTGEWFRTLNAPDGYGQGGAVSHPSNIYFIYRDIEKPIPEWFARKYCQNLL